LLVGTRRQEYRPQSLCQFLVIVLRASVDRFYGCSFGVIFEAVRTPLGRGSHLRHKTSLIARAREAWYVAPTYCQAKAIASWPLKDSTRGNLRLEYEGRTARCALGTGSSHQTPRVNPLFHATARRAEYIAVCLPAFSPATVHRDE
jgi:hypothetical protein